MKKSHAFLLVLLLVSALLIIVRLTLGENFTSVISAPGVERISPNEVSQVSEEPSNDNQMETGQTRNQVVGQSLLTPNGQDQEAPVSGPLQGDRLQVRDEEIRQEALAIFEGGQELGYLMVTYGQGVGVRNLTLSSKRPLSNLVLKTMSKSGKYEEKLVPMLEKDLAYEELSALYVYQASFLVPEEGIYYGLISDQASSPLYDLAGFTPDKHKILVFGDLQGYKASQYEVFRQLYDTAAKEFSPDGVFFVGDLVDTATSYDQWQYFEDALKGLGGTLPFATAIGNHDAGGKGVYFRSHFSYDLVHEGVLSDRVATLDLPLAKVFVWDTESPSTFERQAKLLKETMESTSALYRIVIMHRSVYPMFYEEAYIQDLAPYFEAAKVDLILSGHDHIYHRTAPEEGIYVVTGSGSGSKYYDQSGSRSYQGLVYDENTPVWLEVTMTPEFLSIQAKTRVESGVHLVDSFRIRP